MNREVHVRFREDVGVKFPCVTRFGCRFGHMGTTFFYCQTNFLPYALGNSG